MAFFLAVCFLHRSADCSIISGTILGTLAVFCPLVVPYWGTAAQLHYEDHAAHFLNWRSQVRSLPRVFIPGIRRRIRKSSLLSPRLGGILSPLVCGVKALSR